MRRKKKPIKTWYIHISLGFGSFGFGIFHVVPGVLSLAFLVALYPENLDIIGHPVDNS